MLGQDNVYNNENIFYNNIILLRNKSCFLFVDKMRVGTSENIDRERQDNQTSQHTLK